MKKTAVVTILLPLLMVCPTMWSAAGQEAVQTKQDAVLTKQISEVLTEAGKIKVGMKREDLMRVFTTEGGIFTPMRRTFVYQRCTLIKVDVEFAVAGKNGMAEELPSDKILKISKPYLGWNVID